MANPQIRYAGVYGRVEFPAYVYQEYPKAIKLSDRKTVIVQSLRDELNLKAEKMAGEPEPTKHPVESERDELAAKLAVEQDAKRISDEKIATLQAQVEKLLAAQEAQNASQVKPPPMPAPLPDALHGSRPGRA